MTDGSRRAMQLEPDGRLPRTLGVDSGPVQSLQVALSSEILRTITLIDTPGLGSANEQISAQTEELLAIERRSRQAAASADAIVFVLNQNPRADELEALNSYRSRGGQLERMAATAVGVLTKADQLGDRASAWPAAVAMSARYAQQLRSVLLTIVPTIGLLAETAESAALTEIDAANIASLARMDAVTRNSMLLSGDRFLAQDCEVPVAERRRLLTLLGLYGIDKAIELVTGGTTNAASLRRELSQMSGISSLRQNLAEAFTARGRTLRAYSILKELFSACFTRVEDANHASLTDIRAKAEDLLKDRAARELELTALLGSVEAGEARLPEDLNEDLHNLVSGLSPKGADIRGSVARWRTFALTAQPSERAIALGAIRALTARYESSEAAS